MSATDIDELLKHLELYCSDRAIAEDMDCVRSLVAGWRLDVVNEYAKARRRAPGFRKGDWKANNHNRITQDSWDRINARYEQGMIDRTDIHSVACGACGITFAARRSDARYCGPKCRQRAARSVTDNRGKAGSTDLGATSRNSEIPDPGIGTKNAPASVTGQAA